MRNYDRFIIIFKHSQTNTAAGLGALVSNITGANNTGIGNAALSLNKAGIGNTGIGTQALSSNITGSQNSALGYLADVSSGDLQNAMALGYLAFVTASNKIRLGNVAVTVVESNAGSWTVSDGRFKNNIKENVKGLEFIKLLKPITYNFDVKKFQEFLMQNYSDSLKNKRMAAMNQEGISKASGILQSGFIAQDVGEAVKKSGYNFNGVHAPDNPTDNWSLSYEKLVVPLVKAVQELSAKNDDLQNQIDQLKAMVLSINQNNSAMPVTNVTLSNASLEQNVPNPFTQGSSIGYTLPREFTNAQITITDISGKILRVVNVSGRGKGKLNVDAATLASGAYNYSLIVEGKLIAIKQMLLSK